ncbi:hypothetical protein EJV47_17940 [Hymenobacter gummosus]|uniref:Uncharacterized protein n=1 Tax=Hymenobacter gummosus TaxID=1776032 RepID=A0A3S0QGF1_9BACT|nr:hypothetical protein [Hymenobacter gummosus]RTQ47803.1 hypothetical protein EJV47_17940 [Hymenobacter gummosus]
MFQSDRLPSKPEAFGYKQTWLAVKDADPFELLHDVNVRQGQVYAANWQEGLAQGDTFISPAIGPWTLVINPLVMVDLTEPQTQAFLSALSRRFGEVQFFGNHRVAGYGAWGRFVGGVPTRLFSTADGVTRLNQGPLADLELRYIADRKQQYAEEGFDFPEDELSWLGDEDDVMEMAGLWSINPQTLDEQPETLELGLLIVPSRSRG